MSCYTIFFKPSKSGVYFILSVYFNLNNHILIFRYPHVTSGYCIRQSSFRTKELLLKYSKVVLYKAI